MSELFAPQNLLEQCQGLQEVIASVPDDEKRTAGSEARDMILEREINYHGATKLEIRTLGAFALPDGLTLESHVFPVISYPGMRLNGTLANVTFFSFHRMHTLSWMIAEPKIRKTDGEVALPPVEVDFDAEGLGQVQVETGRTLRRPLYLPVGMIDSVLVAA